MALGPFIAAADVQKAALVPDPAINRAFNAAIAGLPATMGVAVVDLTDGQTQYAVNTQEHVEKHIFSLAKIAPLFVAFRLRERLRNQFAGDPATTADQLVANVEAAWKTDVANKAKLKAGSPDFPRLKKIFDLTAPAAGGRWAFNFMGPDSPWQSLEDLDDAHGGNIPKSVIDGRGFSDRMKLMVRMSDNMATGSVVSDLGLSYVLGTLTNEELYSTAKHGLWLSNTYGYDSKFAGFEGPGDDITAGGTAFAIAAYFTLVFQKKLVNTDTSLEMLDILKERSSADIGTRSLYLRQGGLPANAVTFSKIGMGSTVSEGAIIEYTLSTPAGPKNIKYVAVALQSHTVNLSQAINKIDAFVRSQNP